jgi:hypothetical protein
MVDERGRPVEPSALTEVQAFQRVFLLVPSTRAAALHSKLRQATGKTAWPVTTKFPWLPPGQTIIMVEAQL